MVSVGGCLTCFTIAYLILVIVGAALFGASFAVIDFNRAGLQKNKFTISIDSSQIYQSGRYFCGITGTFITYDTTWQTIVFSNDTNSDSGFISAKTSESASIDLEVTLMYRLQPEFLYSLYQKYPGQNQQSYMVNSAKQTIQQVTNNYALKDFFQNREIVASAFAYNISTLFRSQYGSEVTLFLLKQISFDSSFESQYLSAAILLRQQQVSINQQALQIIIGETATLTSSATKNVSEILTNATAEATSILATGAAQGDALILKSQVTAYQIFQTNIFNGTTGQANLLRYLFYDQVSQSPSGVTYAGFSDSITITVS